MTATTRLPLKVELALVSAISEIRNAGGDDLTLRAIVQELHSALEAREIELRPGFRSTALNVIDLTGVNRVAQLRARASNPVEAR